MMAPGAQRGIPDWRRWSKVRRHPHATFAPGHASRRVGDDAAVTICVTAAEVAEHIRQRRHRTTSTLLVAIDGEGGAGKSTLAAWLAAAVGAVTVVCLDDFARPSAPGWDRERLIRQVLDPLLAGCPGCYQRWDWSTDRGAEWHEVPVGGVVIVEGVSAIREELSDRWDLTLWVSTPRRYAWNAG